MKNSAETQSAEPRARRQPKASGNGSKATTAAARDPEDVRQASDDHGGDTGRHLVEDANLMAETMTDAATEIQVYLREQATRRPYVALGAAAGIGFVLGGGLSLRLTTTLLTIGGRLLVTQLWQLAAQRATAH
jgi:ElaB/YqjD/DUF883 family membrane-anchored ribosome-binding protein